VGELVGDGIGPDCAGDPLIAVDEPSRDVVSWPMPTDEPARGSDADPVDPAAPADPPARPLDPGSVPAIPAGEAEPRPLGPAS